jgi:hypothetical protein
MSQSAKSPEPQETIRRGRAGPLGADAVGLASAAMKRAGFPDSTLVTRWRQIAGDAVADVAEPVRFQEGPNGAVLSLRCETGAAVFLQHETRPLIGRLNAFLGPGRIARIRLVPGPLSLPQSPKSHPLLGRAIPSGPAETGLSGALARLSRLRKSLRK